MGLRVNFENTPRTQNRQTGGGLWGSLSPSTGVTESLLREGQLGSKSSVNMLLLWPYVAGYRLQVTNWACQRGWLQLILKWICSMDKEDVIYIWAQTHTIKYYSTMEKNESLHLQQHGWTWQGALMLSEMSDLKDKYCATALTHGI